MSSTPIVYLYWLSLATTIILALGGIIGWIERQPVVGMILIFVLLLEVTLLFLIERIFEE